MTRRTWRRLAGLSHCWVKDASAAKPHVAFNVIFTLLPVFAGLKEDFQSDVFKVLAAILHLGNMEIRNSGEDKSSVPVSNLCMQHATAGRVY